MLRWARMILIMGGLVVDLTTIAKWIRLNSWSSGWIWMLRCLRVWRMRGGRLVKTVNNNYSYSPFQFLWHSLHFSSFIRWGALQASSYSMDPNAFAFFWKLRRSTPDRIIMILRVMIMWPPRTLRRKLLFNFQRIGTPEVCKRGKGIIIIQKMIWVTCLTIVNKRVVKMTTTNTIKVNKNISQKNNSVNKNKNPRVQ